MAAPQPITCRAAILWERHQPLSIETVTVAPPKKDEIRIRMLRVSVCHTEIAMVTGLLFEKISCPIILGHEGVGVVESVGEGVDKFKVGDTVIPSAWPHCEVCENCLHFTSGSNANSYRSCVHGGQINTMLMLDGTTRITSQKRGGISVISFGCLGLFSEYTTIPCMYAVRVDPRWAKTPEVTAFGCGVMTGVGAAKNTAGVQPGDAVAVFGMGAVGLSALRSAYLCGAKPLIAVDIRPDREELAKEFGATAFVNPTKIGDGKSTRQAIMDANDGKFVDIAIECVGKIETMEEAFDSTNPFWGRTAIIGAINAPKGFGVNPFSINMGRTITGSIIGGWGCKRAIPILLDEFSKQGDGLGCLRRLITHRKKFDEINDAMDLCAKNESIRTVVEF